MFPPIPPWEGIHPVIVHFPVALLLVTPLLLLLSFLPKIGRCFSYAALVLMVVGTGMAYVAVASGEAGAQLVVRTPEIDQVLHDHEEAGETVRLLFTILTVLYLLLLIAPFMVRKIGRPQGGLPRIATVIAHVVFLVAYLACDLAIARTGHLGGLLVHQYGVQAWISGS